ncbi:14669_t:CDS:2, partial [Gigaspora rosea]
FYPGLPSGFGRCFGGFLLGIRLLVWRCLLSLCSTNVHLFQGSVLRVVFVSCSTNAHFFFSDGLACLDVAMLDTLLSSFVAGVLLWLVYFRLETLS